MNVSDYKLETLRHDAEFVLYRGLVKRQHNKSPSRLLILAPVLERPAPETLRRMEHELSLKEELDADWAVRPLTLTQYQGRSVLVLEDPGGEPLDRLVREPMELGLFLRLGIRLSAAVSGLHRRGVIHKDIKPANVLVNPSTSEARLTGFGIATRLPCQRQSPESPEFIAGTLPYMAPEQTGRMNRSIDSRSDLYSLGVSLYESVTGALPFSASDPMEWVHCHIARQPVAPCERRKDIPPSVSAIMMKLLAKTPEERYQTAAGVEYDLRRCLHAWESQHRIEEFPLGEHDTPDRLVIPEKLYGREREVEMLLAAFDRVVASGTPELVLVSGYSGIGKSSLVNELHKVLVPPRALFASGKFDQYKRDIPYSTLTQGFQNLIRPLLAKSDTELAGWRGALQEALGPNARLIVDLVPELKLITGEPPPVPEVPPQDAQRRFQLVFRRFIGVFARPEHPLALFLDDLQWIDAATLDVIEDLLTQSDVQHLMLIGAYRDNEVDVSHPLMCKLDAIRQVGAPVQEITLAPLVRDDLVQLIADALRCKPERAAPLAQLVHEKTGGNPFFAIQFLLALAEEGLLVFDHGKRDWTWDIERIHTKGYTDNIVDLMVGKVGRLPLETQIALQKLACLGNAAKVSTLSLVCGTAEAQLHADLFEAVRTELVTPQEGSYKFIHDRVQEAAYSLIPEESRAETHLRIGRLLVAHTRPEEREEAIFEIVNQLNRGVALITSRDEREELAELNLIAGKRAKASTAYASALTYLTTGVGLLPDDAWERLHELKFALELNRAECEFLTGEFALAEERLIVLANRGANETEQATVAGLRIDLYAMTDVERASAVGLEYLRRVAIEWPAHPGKEDALREYERMRSLLGSRSIEELIGLPLASDPAAVATIHVLVRMVPIALTLDPNLPCLLMCRAVSLCLEHGNCDASCYAYAELATFMGPYFGDYQAGFRLAKLAYELVERLGLRRFEARTYHVCGFFMAWSSHVRAARLVQRRAFDAANRDGDLTHVAFCCYHLNTNLLAAGDPLSEVQREAENGLAFVRKIRFDFAVDVIATQLALIRTLRGLTSVFGSLDHAEFDERGIERRFAENRDWAFAECWYWVRKLQARFFAGDYAIALDSASRAEQLLWTQLSQFETAEYHFYAALSRAASVDFAAPDERQQHFEALAAHCRQLEVWAQHCPENFANRAALVRAEIARIEDRAFDAMDLYEQAIRSARSNGFVQNEALAYERASAFYRARGFEQFADVYLRNARHCYLRWGADGKVRQLDQLYPQLEEDQLEAGARSTTGAPVEHLDLATVVKVSQAVSGEIVLEKLIETLLRTAIEQASAERGLLILAHGGELSIRAEANTSGTTVMVCLRDTPVSAADLPESVIRYVARTQETVIIEDASAQNPFSADEYFREKRARSVLCLPLLKQRALIALLYLENNLATRIFTPARLTVLNVLASQAAMSLQNSILYRDLAESETYLAEAQSLSHTGSFGWVVSTGEIFWSDQTLRIFEYDPGTQPTVELVIQRVHPDDKAFVRQMIERAAQGGNDFDIEHRLLMPDKRIKYLHVIAHRRSDDSGNLEFIGAVRDVTAARIAQQKLKQDEAELRQLINFVPEHVLVMDAHGRRLYENQAMREYFGTSLENIQAKDFYKKFIHPEDVASGALEERERAVLRGNAWQGELRLRRKDGEYRWFLIRSNPLRDQEGNVMRRYATATDIEDRKRAEERVRKENVALREEIDKASMFEEIVGTSAALKEVLSRVSQVAPTDATVLLTGETGTGKELIARAIHKRSQRSAKAFVTVNCAAIPPALIGSELFGHEKGAFTGALQRRLGRFELAEGGTIFLDEIGEVPPETQTALLRVLQEREFERVGGTQTIRADVRVIAATNRDLKAAITNGTFRSDLYYRLQVFPIEIRPLRERKDDIPLLVEY
ncbi:MAG TPA: sigma 54-interacting transcriptional regulator, partial [Candidatus Binatia bacterium]|nr:sigma 54-interacting transcriptional regulator [Candidatus Binatia bacterium]